MSAFVIFSLYSLIANFALYQFVTYYIVKTATSATKLMLAFSLYCCLSAVVLTPIDLYQSLHDQRWYELTNYWRFLYWVSFVFGYVVFVVVAEKDRVGEEGGLLSMLIGFYRERLWMFASGGVAFLIFLILLIRADMLKM